MSASRSCPVSVDGFKRSGRLEDGFRITERSFEGRGADHETPERHLALVGHLNGPHSNDIKHMMPATTVRGGVADSGSRHCDSTRRHRRFWCYPPEEL